MKNAFIAFSLTVICIIGAICFQMYHDHSKPYIKELPYKSRTPETPWADSPYSSTVDGKTCVIQFGFRDDGVLLWRRGKEVGK